MRTRPFKDSDLKFLKAMAAASGFPYPDVSRVESLLVVVDDDDKPMMAAAAERIVQMYLWCGDFERPHAKMYALRILHDAVAKDLRAKGYASVEAFLPPSIAQQFAKRLERTFGWVKNWPSWTHRT